MPNPLARAVRRFASRPAASTDALSPTTGEDDQLARLRMVHDELQRQREATAGKANGQRARATLLIGASTVVTGVQAPRIPDTIRELLNMPVDAAGADIAFTIAALALAVLATLVAVTAGIFGLRLSGVDKGEEIDVTKLATNVLELSPTLYVAEWSLLRDKLNVHNLDVYRLELRRKDWTRGSRWLVVSWALTILQFGVSF